jgi:hypothetical protein
MYNRSSTGGGGAISPNPRSSRKLTNKLPKSVQPGPVHGTALPRAIELRLASVPGAKILLIVIMHVWTDACKNFKG